ncbi:SRPBCC family protein [Lysobacter solisilvae (ex Woo and Kim 2020)]|uniref:SRPBCC family protein n=1 Tax=Agrilutibacter terrestris TaxID=2865112 RepID=A0A7H0G0S3_9GAMM|nr:SRPBCC family protein [Lysobacter terrestris]QNP41889.1 SRPBCC family protein [Lysobacter terrestris]
MNMHTAMPEADYGVRTAPDTVRIERLLPGPIERVWRYLTDPELRAQWFAGGDIEPRTGGHLDLRFHNSALTENDDPPPPKYAAHAGEFHMQCTVTEFDPPHVLGFTFGSGESPSQVHIELTARGDEVQLLLVHSRLATRDGMLSVSAGWHAHLNILRDRMSGRTPDGLWRTHTRLEAEYAQRLA